MMYNRYKVRGHQYPNLGEIPQYRPSHQDLVVFRQGNLKSYFEQVQSFDEESGSHEQKFQDLKAEKISRGDLVALHKVDMVRIEV